MPYAEHSAPIYENEEEPPFFSDERVSPWIDRLKELGVVDASDNCIKSARLSIAQGNGIWIFRMEWEDESQ